MVDFSALFGKGELNPEISEDGLHLNPAGIGRFTAIIQAIAIAAGSKACP